MTEIEIIKPVAIGAGVGAAVALVGLVAAILIGRRRALPPSRGAVALALGLGTFVGQFVAAWPTIAPLLPKGPIPWPEWSPAFWAIFSPAERLPLLIPPIALLLGVLDAGWPSPGWARWENRLLATLLAVWLLTGWTTEEDHWQVWGMRPLVGKAAIFGVIIAAWTNLEWLASRIDGARLLLPLLVAAGAAAGMLPAAAQLAFGFLVVPVVAALAVAWLVSWFAPGISLARGGVPVLALTLAALLTEAFLNDLSGRLPRAAVLLLAAAPLMLWVTRIGPARRLRAWQATILGTLAIAIPLLVAVVLVVRAIPPEATIPAETPAETTTASPS